MTLQPASYSDSRDLKNTAMPRTMRYDDRAFAPPRRRAPRRVQLTTGTAANDGSLQLSIAEMVYRWVDQNPAQLYRGGA